MFSAVLILSLALLTKDSIWSYEKEWRFINFSSLRSDYVEFPYISCIYIGSECSSVNKKIILDVAHKFNIPLHQMVMDRGTFSLHSKKCE